MTDRVDLKAHTMTTPSQTVYLVEDDQLSQRATAFVLTNSGYDVRCFDDATSFLAAVNQDSRGCVLLDIHLPDLSGNEVADRLRERGLNLPIVFLTGTNDVPTAVRAMRQGAVDLLTKPSDHEPLLEAIARAQRQDEQAQVNRQTRDLLAQISPREREVLDLLLTGKSNKQIGFELGISQRTVEVHRARIMSKMNSESLAQIATRLASLKDNASLRAVA
jgi:RNA polymerase sigma factor (sigma-70 family)